MTSSLTRLKCLTNGSILEMIMSSFQIYRPIASSL